MQQERKKLTPRFARDDSAPDAPLTAQDKIGQSIRHRMCVTAVYNRVTMLIAPHALYTRHDDLFVDGVVLEKQGLPARELKLGVFKLAGLNELAVTVRPFEPSALCDPHDPKYEGTLVRMVKAG